MKFFINFFQRSTWMVVVLVLGSGCDSFVTVDLPTSQLTSSTVFEDKATANAAMTSIYSNLRDAGLFTGTATGLTFTLGVYTDELDFYGTPGTALQPFYTNAVLPTNTTVANWWSSSYQQIYAANAVYEGVNRSTGLLPADRNQFKGEALFVRAMVHFQLMQLFGAIPYVTTTDYLQNQSIAKITPVAVGDLVIADLLQAVDLLPADYFGGTRIRPNRYVAMALLARVYLHQGRYAEAADAASGVLNATGLYSLVSDLEATFLKDSPSTLLQWIPQAAGRNTDEGAGFIFTAGPPPLVALRSELIAAFEPGDLRKTHWIKAVTDGTSTWYHPYKYKQQTFTGTTLEYAIVMRLSELYLIRAEARAQQGFLSGACDDLNVLRNLAGLGPVTANTLAAVLTAVNQERRVELFAEGGHRFMDLKRSGTLTSVLSGSKPGWDSHESLFPLPANELVLNSNLVPQNLGY